MLNLPTPYATLLNCCRWIAALLVVLQHLRHLLFVDYGAVVHKSIALKAFYFLTGLGTPAVVVFFVMSGMLVGGTAAKRFASAQYDATDYAVHRASRIYTVLLPALLVGGILDMIGLLFFNDSQLYTNHRQYLSTPIGSVVAETLNLRTFLGNAAMTQSWLSPVYGSNVVLWSLAYEWWYYCLFWAVLGAASPSRRIAARLAFGAFGVVLLCVLPKEILAWFSIWLIGVALAWQQRLAVKIHPVAGLLPFGAILVGVQYSYTFKAGNVPDSFAIHYLKDLAVAIGFCLLLLSVSRLRTFRFGSARLHAAMADFSYTTYLVHFPFSVLLVAMAYDCLGIRFVQQPTVVGGAYFVALLVVMYLYSYGFATLTEHKTGRVRQALRRGLDALNGLRRAGKATVGRSRGAAGAPLQ
ncbi:MAG: O-antigen acetylase [Herminiimonas sp.]|nr:O-antigen acetylase [Herminiimonas sp.]